METSAIQVEFLSFATKTVLTSTGGVIIQRGWPQSREKRRRRRGPRTNISRAMPAIRFKGQVRGHRQRRVRWQEVRTQKAGNEVEFKVTKGSFST